MPVQLADTCADALFAGLRLFRQPVGYLQAQAGGGTAGVAHRYRLMRQVRQDQEIVLQPRHEFTDGGAHLRVQGVFTGACENALVEKAPRMRQLRQIGGEFMQRGDAFVHQQQVLPLRFQAGLAVAQSVHRVAPLPQVLQRPGRHALRQFHQRGRSGHAFGR